MKLTGKQILESKELQEFLQDCMSRVLFIQWHDGSTTNGYGKEIYVQYVGEFNELGVISVVDGVWSNPISNDMVLTIENPNTELYNVFTSTEASLLWGKEESTIRKAIQDGRFVEWIDYRKAGRITLIKKEAIERIYGKLEDN